jgi:hypothetical protein
MRESKRSFWTTPNGLAAIVLIGVVIYYLLAEHRAHFFSALPFLVLLLCPLMHVFMHGGHRHGGHGHGEQDRDDSEESGDRD